MGRKNATQQNLDETADETHPSVGLTIGEEGDIRIEVAPATALINEAAIGGHENITVDGETITITGSNLVAVYRNTGEKAADGAAICTLVSVTATPDEEPDPQTDQPGLDEALAEIETLKARIDELESSAPFDPVDRDPEPEPEPEQASAGGQTLIARVSAAMREAGNSSRHDEQAALAGVENALGELRRAAVAADGKLTGDMAVLIAQIAVSL